MALAEDRAYYTLRFVRPLEDGGYEVADDDEGVELIRVSHFINEVLAKPPQAMAYHGFRTGLKGVHDALIDDPSLILDASNPEEIEAALKARGSTPRDALRSAGDRGNTAHKVLELLAEGNVHDAGVMATKETLEWGTHYSDAVVDWWKEQVLYYQEKDQIEDIVSEKRVWSLDYRYCGTFDLGIKWKQGYWPDGTMRQSGWEILDLKTHKPAKGFTLEGKGPAYVSDAVQCRAYRMAFEEMGLGKTIRQRVIVARENGRYLEDTRSVPENVVAALRQLYDQRTEFERGTN